MGHKGLRCSIKLIADHGNLLPGSGQIAQHFLYSCIRTRVIETVNKVIFTEILIGFGKQRIVGTARNSPFHQLLHPVSDKHSHLFDAPFGHTITPKRMVAAISKVSQRVKQRTVQIENIGLITHHRKKVFDNAIQR